MTEHIIAATGYKVDLDRLKFLEPGNSLEAKVGPAERRCFPRAFESSIPGLYFAGVAAANSFGPVMRFAFGAGFAARTLARTFDESRSQAESDVGSGCGA